MNKELEKIHIKRMLYEYAELRMFLSLKYPNIYNEFFEIENTSSTIKEEKIDGTIFPNAPKYRCVGCGKIHQDYDYNQRDGDILLSTDNYNSQDADGFAMNLALKSGTDKTLSDSPIKSNRKESESHAFAKVGASDKYVGMDISSTKEKDELKGCGKMYCLIDGCGEVDETHSAYCIKHGRSHHGICGTKEKIGTGYCKECQKSTKEVINNQKEDSITKDGFEPSDTRKGCGKPLGFFAINTEGIRENVICGSIGIDRYNKTILLCPECEKESKNEIKGDNNGN